jgi:hypothetical protein
MGPFVPDIQAVVGDIKAILDQDSVEMANMCHIVVVDACGPPEDNPAHDRLLSEHVGTHPAIMEQVLSSDVFINDIGQQLRAQWPKQPMDQDHAIGVIVFCHSGKHRSVAWSYLIHALMMSLGYDCIVSQTAMNIGGKHHQAHCAECKQGAPHHILNKAIVKLSLVPAA